jgi:hypothetical protein
MNSEARDFFLFWIETSVHAQEPEPASLELRQPWRDVFISWLN